MAVRGDAFPIALNSDREFFVWCEVSIAQLRAPSVEERPCICGVGIVTYLLKPLAAWLLQHRQAALGIP